MAIKVIIMDIDGTLVNDEKVITPLTKETLLKAQDKGVRLVLASWRPTSGLLKLAEELDMENHHGLFVCFNGSKVVDCQSHETLYNHAISVEDSKAVLEHLKNFKAKPMITKTIPTRLIASPIIKFLLSDCKIIYRIHLFCKLFYIIKKMASFLPFSLFIDYIYR